MIDVSLIDLNALKTFKVDIQKIIDAKITKASTANTIYANDLSGNETNLYYSSDYQNKQWQIVQRDGNNDILVPSAPSSNNAATSKSYVDSNAGTKLYRHIVKCKFEQSVEAPIVFISTNSTPIASSQLLNADLNAVFTPIITAGIAHYYKTDLCIPSAFGLYFKQSGSGESLTFTLYIKVGNAEYAFTEIEDTDTVTEL